MDNLHGAARDGEHRRSAASFQQYLHFWTRLDQLELENEEVVVGHVAQNGMVVLGCEDDLLLTLAEFSEALNRRSRTKRDVSSWRNVHWFMVVQHHDVVIFDIALSGQLFKALRRHMLK